jgi:hypothetical protein
MSVVQNIKTKFFSINLQQIHTVKIFRLKSLKNGRAANYYKNLSQNVLSPPCPLFL